MRFDVRRRALSARAPTAPGVRETRATDVSAEMESLRIVVTPRLSPSGEGRIGARSSRRTRRFPNASRAIRPEAASLAAREFARLTKLVSASLFSLVSDFDKAKENVSGPIAIVGVGAEVMRTSDLTGLYQFASVININLAVVNALPLPALDGGFLLLIAIEAARGEEAAHGGGSEHHRLGRPPAAGLGDVPRLGDTLNLFNGK